MTSVAVRHINPKIYHRALGFIIEARALRTPLGEMKKK